MVKARARARAPARCCCPAARPLLARRQGCVYEPPPEGRPLTSPRALPSAPPPPHPPPRAQELADAELLLSRGR